MDWGHISAMGWADDLMAFELSQAEVQAVARVIGHAQERLTAHSDSAQETIRNASGAELLSLLYPRIGVVVARGGSGVPMQISEIRHVESAIINLESYGGHETVLCEGYALLARLLELSQGARSAQTEDGILTLPGAAPQWP
ncbi:hypothetical protein [Streptomyces sp. NPDC058644]|uniref:hypothetical protein n=1 Tax=unclassified Streptomyces TaxID=2593676 RepID=UPI00364ECBC9